MERSILTTAAVLAVAGSTATAAPVDLSSWFNEGGSSNWVLAADNNSVLQTVNGAPAVFVNGVDSQNQKLSGTIEVQTTGDDDFIGFVLGYDSGDFGSATADYLLVDWKQNDQNFGSFGLGKAGLAISRVEGVLGDDSGAWSHDPANNVTELQRGTTLGSTGWDDNTEYMFDLVFQAGLVEVFVDGTKELSVTGSFENGSFGFYNYSQANARYAGITQVSAPPTPSPIPLPAGLPLLATALGAFSLLRRRPRG